MLFIKANTFSIAATDSEKNQIMLEEKTLQVGLKRIEKRGKNKGCGGPHDRVCLGPPKWLNLPPGQDIVFPFP